jgi:hypothetical protein
MLMREIFPFIKGAARVGVPAVQLFKLKHSINLNITKKFDLI